MLCIQSENKLTAPFLNTLQCDSRQATNTPNLFTDISNVDGSQRYFAWQLPFYLENKQN